MHGTVRMAPHDRQDLSPIRRTKHHTCHS
jgi:hypothetical protein